MNMKKTEFFKVEGDRITRVRKYCPKCGPAVFLADHKNRFSCGKCGYTEFKGGGKPSKPAPVEGKPVEKPVKAPTEIPAAEPPKEEVPPTVEGEPEKTEPETTEKDTPAEEKPKDEIPEEEESSEVKEKAEKSSDESSDEDKKE